MNKNIWITILVGVIVNLITYILVEILIKKDEK